MTCEHVVNVALKKVSGVESVDVSLNKGLANVRLKPGNTVTVPQLWQLIHEKGYTPKTTTVSVRGDLASLQGRLQLKVSGTSETFALVADTKNAMAYSEASKKLGQTVIVQGVMMPAKDLKAPVPLQVSQVKEAIGKE
jgi:copper chaperone CopZ